MDICKRLLPEYGTFHENNKWGNPDILAEGIKYCAQILNGDKADYYQIEEIKSSIDEVTPNTDDFGDWDGSYALNACVAIIESLEFILDKNIVLTLYKTGQKSENRFVTVNHCQASS